MKKILFVCLGNICRSPLAEGLAYQVIEARGLQEKLAVDSCGTSKYHIGQQPDSRTVANARENGVDLDHEARQFIKKDFRTFDYIVAMDQANLNSIRRVDQTRQFEDKLYLMRDFDMHNKGADVPDPYFGGEDGFQKVFDILERSTRALIDYIENDLEIISNK